MSDAPARDIQTAIDTAAQLGIFDLFEETARRSPGCTALTDSARSFCYAQTRERVVALSERLRARRCAHATALTVCAGVNLMTRAARRCATAPRLSRWNQGC